MQFQVNVSVVDVYYKAKPKPVAHLRQFILSVSKVRQLEAYGKH